ncbi:MAG: NADH-quinone oxidoreductase subunit A [Candidatus Fibromonas sp.]|jgi:NADH-quinone oxidoreductase subunit A|nr:NADH-quinone oxidoreductase subunit A [Candidatus Fibromonas sp.]
MTSFDIFFPIFVLALLAVVVPFGMMFANWVLSPQTQLKNRIKTDVYECGLSNVIGSASERFPVKYYVVAMLFLVFDLEVAFLYPLAIEFKSGGWEMFGFLMVFLFILEVGYLYIIRKGVLNWSKISDNIE